MKQLIGASCRITIFLNNTQLQYTAKKIIDISDTHITFIDKFGDTFIYKISDIVQIQSIIKGEGV